MTGQPAGVSQDGIDLIVRFEGFSATLYDDPSPARNCTIGYGFMVHEGPCDGRAEEAPYLNGITEAQAQAQLAQAVRAYAAAVLQFSAVTLTQHQIDALTSFCYNVGVAGYRDSTVRIAVNTGGNVCAALREYVHAGGQVLPGLVARREAECALYYKEEAGVTQAQYDELKADIGAVLTTLGALGDRIDKQGAEILIQNWLLATGRTAEVKLRINYEATATGVTLP